MGGQADELAAYAALELLEVAGGLGEDGSQTGALVLLGEEGKRNVKRGDCRELVSA